jgi:hypothetical protein
VVFFSFFSFPFFRDWMHRLSCELVITAPGRTLVPGTSHHRPRIPIQPTGPHPTSFKPALQGHQATVPRGPYVSKRFGLPLARFMTNHTHTSQAAPRRQMCEFCRFIFHKRDGEARVDQLKRVIDCPAFFVPDKTRWRACNRRTVKQGGLVSSITSVGLGCM